MELWWPRNLYTSLFTNGDHMYTSWSKPELASSRCCGLNDNPKTPRVCPSSCSTSCDVNESQTPANGSSNRYNSCQAFIQQTRLALRLYRFLYPVKRTPRCQATAGSALSSRFLNGLSKRIRFRS